MFWENSEGRDRPVGVSVAGPWRNKNSDQTSGSVPPPARKEWRGNERRRLNWYYYPSINGELATDTAAVTRGRHTTGIVIDIIIIIACPFGNGVFIMYGGPVTTHGNPSLSAKVTFRQSRVDKTRS